MAALKRLMVLVGLATAYFVAAKLGLRLADVHPSATAVWPGTGIALAAFLILGYGVWPAIFVGAFLVNVTTAGTSVPPSRSRWETRSRDSSARFS